MNDKEWQEMAKAEDALRDHIQERDSIKAGAKKSSKEKTALNILSLGHTAPLHAVLNQAQKWEIKQHDKAIDEIYRKYPQLRALFNSDAARDEMAKIKAVKPKHIPRVHHTKLKVDGSKYEVVDVNSDGSVDEGYGKKSPEVAWRFIRGCNRRADSDGWTHYWKERGE